MLKKMLAMLLTITLIWGGMGLSVRATEEHDEPNESGLYVLTEAAPKDILNYAANEFSESIKSYMENNSLYFDSDMSEIRLGMPINIKEFNSDNRIYHFPVFNNQNILAMFTVYCEPDGYNVQLEDNLLARKLDLYMNQTSTHNPLAFISTHEGFYAVLNDALEPLTPDSVDNNTIPNHITKKSISEENVVNLSDTLAVASTGVELFATSATLSVKSVPQTDDGKFTGTQMDWCGAATTAAIINYKKSKKLTAKDVTVKALGSAKDEGITNAQVISVAKDYSLSPKSGDPLSSSSVVKEIDDLRPVYMQMQRSTGTGKAYHALVLIGYDSSNYTIINPWYENSLTIKKQSSGTDVKYVTGDRTYKWYTSVYNWK